LTTLDEQAIGNQCEVRTVCFEIKHNGKALEIGESEGFVTLMVDTNDHLLGAAVLASSGSELFHRYVKFDQSWSNAGIDSRRDFGASTLG
jgi:pyruvate/2-oxoglutarate dehydrogenase complex dihydrolipoamide dehydrogenase (E3) component